MTSLRNGFRSVLRAFRRYRKLRAGKKTRRFRTLFLVLTLGALAFGFLSALRALEPKPLGERLRIDQLDALAKRKQLTVAKFRDEDAVVVGRYWCPAAPAPAAATAPGAPTPPPPPKIASCDPAATAPVAHEFWMPYPKSDLATGALIKAATEAGAQVAVDPQTPKAQLRLVTTFVLPLVMLANIFALLFGGGRGTSSGIGDVIVFGSLRKRARRRGRAARVTFADVAGADHAVAELAEIVDYLRSPDRYRKIGAQAPKGVLMAGPPGCGKTLLAKACAGEADVPFFSVAGAEFVESLVGVGAARVRDLFRRVRAAAPAIVFIDELDAAGRRRGSGGAQGGSDEREQTLNQLLVEMDGFDAASGIVVIGATNRPDILDPALLRPGRFDRQVTVDQPDREGRKAILQLHARERQMAPGVDFDVLARRTPGFSGAELANVINEAALLAIRAGKTQVGMEELLEANERVVSGPQRQGRLLTAIERRRAAAHEAGHALAAAAFGRAADVHRVSILWRGRTLGATNVGSEATMLTRSDLLARVTTLLAGVAAEEMLLGEGSTGAESDLEEATLLARDIAGRFGMSERLGRVRMLGSAADAFLEAQIPVGEISGRSHEQLDEEVRAILAAAELESQRILAANKRALETLVSRLEAEETIDGAPLQQLLATAVLPPARAKRAPARAGGR